VPEGTATTLAAALDPALNESNGAYLNDSAVYSEFPWAKNEQNAIALWRISEELVDQKFDY
jgi:hypothetical protein